MTMERKPEWLRKKVNPGDQRSMRRLLDELRLNTVCRQALCPNISECFACNQATFLILGTSCTRRCSFCNVDKGVPQAPDRDEPQRVAQAVARLGLSHVVITSPTRDDLADGGAALFADTVGAIRAGTTAPRIELLVPDFGGKVRSLETVLATTPDILAHNLETVPRLYRIRDGADYGRSLELLRRSSASPPKVLVKSGIMLGLGEEEREVVELFRDLRAAGCVYLSIGQYLAPSKRHYPVQEYVTPERFERLRDRALDMGFAHVESGPYVRSSYHAGRYS
jgi:lipoic acid synthetase